MILGRASTKRISGIIILLGLISASLIFYQQYSAEVREAVSKFQGSSSASESKAPAEDHFPPPPPPPPPPEGSPGSDKPHEPRPHGEQKPVITKISDFSPSDRLVIFPKSFPKPDDQLSDFYYNELQSDRYLMGNPYLIRFNNDESPYSDKKSSAIDFNKSPPEDFHSHPFDVFTGHKDIKGDLKKCKDVKQNLDVEITKSKSLDVDMEDLVRSFLKSESTVLEEVKPYFEDDIDNQFKQKIIPKHWYRLAGTSVWLEQYGVHYMISRVIYSPRGARNQPIFSLTYVQLFNDKWEELSDVELIIPTNGPDSIHNQVWVEGTFYTKVHFPSFLPVPTYHDPKVTKSKYYGPEDPRLLLVKNERGYEEPVMIYNSYHRKIVQKDVVDETTETINFGYYRSMFMCYPWQFQRGKRNVNELPHKKWDRQIYNRAIELRRTGVKRLEIQKNWTPFVDYTERSTYNYDKYIYFVYRWEDLEILKCELTDTIGVSSNCEFIYRMDDTLPGDKSVGPLRGGTEMININALVDDYDLQDYISIPKDQEILVGFARAHLKNCGCGQDIYRPNMVVIMKDIPSGKYKIELISSFLSLDVKIIGWNLDEPDNICAPGTPDIFIPNGISSWSVQKEGGSYQDYLTLSYSLSDATVASLEMKGLLKAVSTHFDVHKKGYDNSNVACALEGSRQFCKVVGEKVAAKKQPNADHQNESTDTVEKKPSSKNKSKPKPKSKSKSTSKSKSKSQSKAKAKPAKKKVTNGRSSV